MTEKIGFVGYECEDIVLYLAYCLMQLGRKVVIEDRTEHGMLLRMMESREMSENEEIMFQEIPITNAMIHNADYDVVLMSFGYRLLHPKLYECNQLVLVTDAFPAHAALLDEMEAWDRKQVLLIRNFTESKHGTNYLEVLTGQKLEKVICIPWEERDVRIRNSLGTAEYIRIERLSAAMRDAVQQLLEVLVSDEEVMICKGRKRKGLWENWLHSGRR